jgi:hypothetical protein
LGRCIYISLPLQRTGIFPSLLTKNKNVPYSTSSTFRRSFFRQESHFTGFPTPPSSNEKTKREDCRKKTRRGTRSRSTSPAHRLHPRSSTTAVSPSHLLRQCPTATEVFVSRGGRAAQQEELDLIPSRQHDRSSPPGRPLLHSLPPRGPTRAGATCLHGATPSRPGQVEAGPPVAGSSTPT